MPMALLVFPNSHAKRIKEHWLWNYFNEELCPGCSQSCVQKLIHYANLYEWVITMTYHCFRVEKCNLSGNTGGRSGLGLAKFFSPPKSWNIFALLHFCTFAYLHLNFIFLDKTVYIFGGALTLGFTWSPTTTDQSTSSHLSYLSH